jgi:hypothetical protein
MLFNPRHDDRFGRLTEQLRSARAATSHLISNVIVDACTRLPAVKATRIDRLIEAGAWIDAANALIEIELPAWTLRRLRYANGSGLFRGSGICPSS